MSGENENRQGRSLGLTRRFDWEPQYGFCGEEVTSNEALAAALEVARRRVCQSIVPDERHRDCKYGASYPTGRHGEKTGCPELREVINRLLHRPETFGSEASGSGQVREGGTDVS